MYTPIIKFSHRYDKIPNDVMLRMGTVLLHVFLIDASDIHFDFLKYDTTYFEDNKTKHYELPKDKVLVLLLLTGGLMLWTTIRRHTPEKYEYYKKLIGSEVIIAQK